MRNIIPYREKFFTDEIFPRFSFSRPVFFPDFSPGKEFIPIFFSIINIIIIIFSYLFAKLLLPCFFDVLYLSWLSKASKRIGFKLFLIISISKERVFNFFKDFVWFFDRLCYPRWFKAIQNQITAPSHLLVHLIDPFCVWWFDFW